MKQNFTFRQLMLLGLLAATLVFVACNGSDHAAPQRLGQVTSAATTSPRTTPAGLGTRTISAPFDLGKIIKDVHFAFRADGSAFSGGDDAYTVKVAPTGAFSFKPNQLTPARKNAPPVHAATLATQSMKVGERRLALAETRSRLTDKGYVLLDRGFMQEELTNGKEGLEQSWIFAKRPEGEGALTLSVALSGMSYAGLSAQGLHFRDAANGLGLRYGKATWVDARGVKTAVEARFEAGAIVLVVSEATLAASLYPATLDPTISAEFGIDTPVVAVGVGAQQAPALAFDGTNYLVVWQDARRSSSVGSNIDIYGARVNQNGKLVDAQPFVISAAAGDQTAPKVIFDDTNHKYLVVWQDARHATGSGSDIYGARVSKEGLVLDAAGIAITTAPKDQTTPALGFDGTNYLVVWQSAATLSSQRVSTVTLLSQRVSADGLLLGAGPTTLHTATDQRPLLFGSPSLAFDGSNYLVAVNVLYGPGYYCEMFSASATQLEPIALLVNPEGNVLKTASLSIASQYFFTSGPHSMALAFNGTNYVAAWIGDIQTDSGFSSVVYATFIDKSGQVLDTHEITRAIAPVTGCAESIADSLYDPTIAFDGTNYLVAWKQGAFSYFSHSGDLYAARVSQAGLVLDVMSVAIPTSSNSQQSPALAFDGTNYLVVWQDYRSGLRTDYDIYGARLNKAVVMQDPEGFLISKGPNVVQTPAVAFDGNNYLVVWQDTRNSLNNGLDIFGARVGPTGSLLDPNGILISGAAHEQSLPQLIFDGQNYLVVWQDYRNWPEDYGTPNFDIYGARVSREGTVLDSAGIAISAGPDNELAPKVASDGTYSMVCWHGGKDYYRDKLACTRVTKDGTLRDGNPFEAPYKLDYVRSHAIAFDGTNYLLVVAENQALYAAQLAPDGTYISSTPFAMGANPQYPDNVAIGFDTTNFLVVWEDYDGTNENYGIFATRVSPGGSKLDAADLVVSNAPGDQQRPVLAFDGTRFLVTWSDSRTGTDIYGSYVTKAGEVLDPLGLPLSIASDSVEVAPALACAGTGTCLLAYASDERVKGRTITWTERGQACVKNDECTDGHCVDGVCCNTACDGSCMACTYAKTGHGNGSCAAVPVGSDLDDECGAHADCQLLKGMPLCQCKPGYFGDGNTCTACPAGRISAADGKTCTPCVAGTYQNESSCSACAGGTYSDVGQTSCSATCPAGHFINEAQPGACIPCEAGAYTNADNRKSCLACPPGYTSEAGATTCHTLCGDATVVGNEVCDDGNTDSGDGCNSTCSAIESGWACPPEGGACQLPCSVAGKLYAAGTINPDNACQYCDPTQSTSAFSAVPEGLSCTDDALDCTNDVCDGQGVCTHPAISGCVIAGACVAEGVVNPGNSCQSCQPDRSTTSYSAEAADGACSDDGLACTNDVCDAAGACLHPVANGCLIAGACVEAGNE